MSSDKISYQDFYGIKLKKFYEYVTDVMRDFSFAVHRSIKDEENKRRIEVWRSSKNDNDSAMIWIELVKGDDSIDPYVSTDVLRTMNEEGMTKLFFFTNTDIDPDSKDVLDGRNHYIFTPKDIIETIEAMEVKKVSKSGKKRRNVKVASGYIIIRNHLKQNPPKGRKIFINTSTLSTMADNYINMARQTFNEVDKIDDINEIDNETKERFKNIQLKLIPELRKTLYFKFTDRFDYLAPAMYNIMQNLIVYIGALVEFESEEEMSKARDAVEDELEKLRGIDEKLREFYGEQMKKTEKLSYNLLYASIVVITFMVVFYFIMLNQK